MFEVWIKGEKVKEYPTKQQAYIYLILKHYIYSCRWYKFIDSRCEIREVKNEKH